jgi:hypothetical protein
MTPCSLVCWYQHLGDIYIKENMHFHCHIPPYMEITSCHNSDSYSMSSWRTNTRQATSVHLMHITIYIYFFPFGPIYVGRIMGTLTCDCDHTAYLEQCCNWIGPCLTPASAKPVAYTSPKKETWYFHQSLEEHVEKRISRHAGNAEDQRVVEKLYKCSVGSARNTN